MEIFRLLKNILQWILLIFFISIVLPVILLLLGYRYLIIFLNRVIIPNSPFVTPMTGLDHAFCTDPFHTRPRSGTAFIWICEGKLNPDEILDRFSSILENNSGEMYARLKSVYPSKFMGIPFWRRARKEFEMRDHLRVLGAQEGHNFNEDDLNAFLVKWMRLPFTEGIPFWEAMVVPGVTISGETRSIFGLQTNHAIGDGFSKLCLLEKIVDNAIPPPEVCRVTDKNDANLGGSQLSDLLRLPDTLSKLFCDFLLHKDIFTRAKSSDDVALYRATYPMRTFKEVRFLLGAQGQGRPPLLLLGVTLLAGALRRFLSRLCSDGMTTNFVVALPVRGVEHPPQFCNFWCHTLLNVQIGEESPTKRLSALMDNFSRSVDINHWPEGYSRLVVPIQSLLPTWAWEKVTRIRMGAPIGCTNMVGPAQAVTLCGNRVLQKYAYVGLLWPHSSMTCGFFSYADTLSLTLVANHDVTTLGNNFDYILHQFLQEEVNLMKKEITQ
ncbi:putative diacylglycerol O-acyltransferase tgs1 [Folsomia candida]|uniref:Putative diacylglycerol O-acyltransferase tgs1 n=1 Tax=Folsomia candida TaxID=158441 RepID=A0A226CYU6_FOLCA|nr:putative diacylglycerol O-acyltransferase tgs1 [Folsomia candida]